MIGLVCGQVEKSEKLVNSLEERMAYISSRIEDADSEIRLYYELWFDPLMTVGPSSWIE